MSSSHSISSLLLILLLWGTGLTASAFRIVPESSGDEGDAIWAEYLHTHLSRRTRDSGMSGKLRDMVVRTDIGGGSGYSMREIPGGGGYLLRAGDRETSVWLTYQFISFLAGRYDGIDASGLLPSVLGTAPSGKFRFSYRDVYSRQGLDADMAGMLAFDSLDETWGIWGHNLSKVLRGSLADDSFAFPGGKVTGQLCFSSESLYRATVEYIIDNYGETGGTRFMIMPEDNGTVCMCDRCRRAGNRENSASGAVGNFISRLARRFPGHMFFTTLYGTVSELPASAMPSNTGIMLSAVDLPFGTAFRSSPEARVFGNKVKSCLAKVANVYVWDYCRNFDDYLTPFPCLGTVAARLDYYEELGVEGVFFNGSGYDFSAFDDVQTCVISALMCCPGLDPEEYAAEVFRRFYPECGPEMSGYYLGLEASASGKELSLYGGIGDAVGAYLDPAGFLDFMSGLETASKRLGGDERSRLNLLLSGFHFTSLELARSGLAAGGTVDIRASMDVLGEAAASGAMDSYREYAGALKDYLDCWKKYPVYESRDNDFFESSAPSVAGFDGSGVCLSDNRYGFPSDYHTGWAISSSGRMEVGLPLDFRGKAVFEFSGMSVPRWRLGLPVRIEVWSGEMLVSVTEIPDGEQEYTREVFRIPVDTGKDGRPCRIVVTAASGRKLAVDEISLYY